VLNSSAHFPCGCFVTRCATRGLSERIQDNRFMRLIRHMLKAGYLEEWRYHETLSGAPQGGVCTPILSNIYLDTLDKFVETALLPKYRLS
jgi:retron-type reverse transcriptase